MLPTFSPPVGRGQIQIAIALDIGPDDPLRRRFLDRDPRSHRVETTVLILVDFVNTPIADGQVEIAVTIHVPPRHTASVIAISRRPERRWL